MSKEVKDFQDALIAQKIAKEFSSPEALKKYLQEHPKADPAKHRVAPSKEEKAKAKSDSHAETRKKEEDDFSKSMRDVMKEKGVSEKSVRNWIDKEKSKLDQEKPSDYGKKEKKEKQEDDFANDLHKMLKEKGISPEQAKKFVHEEQKKLAWKV